MPFNNATNPPYRWLRAEVADLEWQCVEEGVLADLECAESTCVPGIDVAREAVAMLLLGRR